MAKQLLEKRPAFGRGVYKHRDFVESELREHLNSSAGFMRLDSGAFTYDRNEEFTPAVGLPFPLVRGEERSIRFVPRQ
jgi:hypothetical protein